MNNLGTCKTVNNKPIGLYEPCQFQLLPVAYHLQFGHFIEWYMAYMMQRNLELESYDQWLLIGLI